MGGDKKTRSELLSEVEALRSRVAELENVEPALRESEATFRAIFERAGVGVAQAEIQTGRFVRVNQAYCDIVGLKAEDLTATTFMAITHPDDLQRDLDAAEGLKANRINSFSTEKRYVRPDGTIVWVDLTVSRMHDPDARPDYAVAVVEDITERKQTEDELNAFYTATTDLMCVASPTEGRFTKVNPACLKILGRSAEELCSRPFEDFVHPNDRESTAKTVASQLEGNPVAHFENRYQHKDGSYRRLSWMATPVLDGKVFATAKDITERKQTEEELERHRNHLEELVDQRTRELERSREDLRRTERLASVGTLAAGVAHQINNPIGAILNAAELALLCGEDPEAREIWQQALEDNVQEAKRCGRIVKSILRFSRDGHAEKSRGDMNEVVERACQLVGSYASKKGVVLEVQTCQPSRAIWMSAIEMEQVLVNVIRNAIESRSEGGRVSVRTMCGSKTISIEVRDNGRGIGQEALVHVFDPFQTTRSIEGGTGLGLSVAHGIVVDHGGTISMESEPGTGTVVAIELPLYVET